MLNHAKKAIPFLLILFWVITALWAVLTPNKTVHNFFKRLDYVIYDMRLRATINDMHYKEQPIFIVDIDNQSIQQEGSWPWSRDKVSALIIKLKALGAQVIAFDTLFSEPETNITQVIENKLKEKQIQDPAFFQKLAQFAPLFDNDEELAKIIKNSKDVVLPFYLHKDHYQQGNLPAPIATLSAEDKNEVTILSLPGYQSNISILQDAAKHTGFVTNVRDEDGVVRRTPLVLRSGDKIYPSLTLSAIQTYTQTKKIKLNFSEVADTQYLTSVSLDDKVIPTDKAGRVMIPFHGKPKTFRYLSATDVLHDRVPAGMLDKALVFVSSTALGLDDLQTTPISRFYPSIEIQANVASGLLDNNFPFIPYWAKAATIGLVLVIGLLFTIVLPLVGPLTSTLLAIFFVGALIGSNLFFWVYYGLVFSFSFPIIMTVMIVLTDMSYGFLFENRRRRLLRKTFSEYVPAEHVKILTENPEKYSLDGETREMTVLFSDIVGFTTISENLDATEIKKMLNQYLTPMTEIIFNHGGTIDKYVGDMIMAFWGAPLENSQHRQNSLETALDMQAKTRELIEEFKKLGWPAIRIGIGLNTGVMNVGDMGSEYRRAYTVLGDSVNTGSRLEATTRYYGVDIVVGENTVVDRDKYLYRLLDRLKVKGKNQATEVFELVCRMTEASDELKAEIVAHEQAMQHYFAQEWEVAKQMFSNLTEQNPDHKLYHLYIARINHFEQNSPGSDWDGSFYKHEK